MPCRFARNVLETVILTTQGFPTTDLIKAFIILRHMLGKRSNSLAEDCCFNNAILTQVGKFGLKWIGVKCPLGAVISGIKRSQKIIVITVN